MPKFLPTQPGIKAPWAAGQRRPLPSHRRCADQSRPACGGAGGALANAECFAIYVGACLVPLKWPETSVGRRHHRGRSSPSHVVFVWFRFPRPVGLNSSILPWWQGLNKFPNCFHNRSNTFILRCCRRGKNTDRRFDPCPADRLRGLLQGNISQ